ncbi:MAG: HK97 family phage prohead protease [Paludibacteraceae bacterium]|nr:HK97 family phage prohead protease [Paludibacteraceae bacterium]
MAKEVVISNGSLNSYGFRVLTEGIDLTQYQRNPILLWMHTRPWRGTTDEVLPLGRVENLHIDGDNLIGTPVFDEGDEFARRVKAKWDAGILKMVSAGLKVIEESSDPSVLLQGQQYATVSRSKLIEVSIVDIGSNDDAIVLYNEHDDIINLAQGKGEIFLTPITNPLTSIQMDVKQIALALGMSETATEQEVLQKAAQLREDASEVVRLRQEAQTRQNEAIVALVDGAISEGKFTADKKDHFVELGKKVGFASLKDTLDLIAPAQKPSNLIHPTNTPATGEYKTLSDVPTDKLEALRKEQPEQYKTLYQKEYGIMPEMND